MGQGDHAAQRGAGMDEITSKIPTPAGDSAAPAKPAPAVGRREDVPRAILLMVITTVLFACASAASKWLVDLYPVGEVLFMRSLSSLIAGAAMILPVSGLCSPPSRARSVYRPPRVKYN